MTSGKVYSRFGKIKIDIPQRGRKKVYLFMGVVKNRAIPFGLKNGMAYFKVLFAIKTESNKHQISKTSAAFF